MKNPYTTAVVVASVLAGIMADRLVIGTAVHAQEATRLDVGSETVFIGMSRDTALAKFAGKYGIGDLNDSSVVIRTPERQSKVSRTVGLLAFQNGKLTSATRVLERSLGWNR